MADEALPTAQTITDEALPTEGRPGRFGWGKFGTARFGNRDDTVSEAKPLDAGGSDEAKPT